VLVVCARPPEAVASSPTIVMSPMTAIQTRLTNPTLRNITIYIDGQAARKVTTWLSN
jgi:hypothetical protein